jgi:MFS family permease
VTYRQLLIANANLRHLWSAQVISEIGDWLNNIAVLALIIELAGPAHEGLAIAIYAVSRHLPLFFFGPIAGITVDRAERRRVMIGADLVRAALALGFILAIYLRSLALAYLVSAALFSIAAFFNAAKRALLPQLARSAAEILTANALSASTTAATLAIGSAFGGFLSSVFNRETVFVINAISFLLSALIVRRINVASRSSTSSKAPTPRAFGLKDKVTLALRRSIVELCDGWRYVRSERMLSAIFIVTAGWGLGNGAARALYSVFGARFGQLVHSSTDFGISVLFAAMGIGGVCGAIIARRLSAQTSLTARLGRSLALDGAALIAFSCMPDLWSGALVLVVREVNYAIWWTAQQTLLMQRIEDRFGGRVFAAHETLAMLAMLGSMLVAGAAADRLGIRPVMASAGVVITVSGALWFLLARERRGPLRRFDDLRTNDDF